MFNCHHLPASTNYKITNILPHYSKFHVLQFFGVAGEKQKQRQHFSWACCLGLRWKVKLQTYFEGPCQSPGILRWRVLGFVRETLVGGFNYFFSFTPTWQMGWNPQLEHECTSRVFRRNHGWKIVQTTSNLTVWLSLSIWMISTVHRSQSIELNNCRTENTVFSNGWFVFEQWSLYPYYILYPRNPLIHTQIDVTFPSLENSETWETTAVYLQQIDGLGLCSFKHAWRRNDGYRGIILCLGCFECIWSYGGVQDVYWIKHWTIIDFL